MMEFELVHELPKSADEAWTIITSDAYEAASSARTGLDRELIESRVDGNRRVRRLRITSNRELPKPIAKVVGANALSYELIETYEDDRRFSTWKVIPSKLQDRVVAQGTYTVVPGPTEGTSVRRITGQVRVSIALVGKKIEDFIGAEVRASYEKSTDFLRQYMREH